MKPEKPIIVTSCCYLETFDTDISSIGVAHVTERFCSRCLNVSSLLVVCSECDDETGEDCTCASDREREAEINRMFSLYRGEVSAGIHIPAGTKPELNPDLDGVY